MKRLAPILLPLLSAFFLYQSVTSYLRIRARGDELGLLSAQVAGLEDKLKEKQDELAYRRSPEFIYKEALEQLGLTNPGEMIAILPDWVEKSRETTPGSDLSPPSSPAASIAREPVPYWKQWRQLFFGN